MHEGSIGVVNSLGSSRCLREADGCVGLWRRAPLHESQPSLGCRVWPGPGLAIVVHDVGQPTTIKGFEAARLEGRLEVFRRGILQTGGVGVKPCGG
jgi:hypothetical protein